MNYTLEIFTAKQSDFINYQCDSETTLETARTQVVTMYPMLKFNQMSKLNG